MGGLCLGKEKSGAIAVNVLNHNKPKRKKAVLMDGLF